MFVRMNPAPDGKGHQGLPAGYEHSEVVSSVGPGAWVLIPNDVTMVVVTVAPGNASQATMESTTDLVRDVITDNGVVPVEWPHGEISRVCQDAVLPVTAVRVRLTSGSSAKFTIRAK